MPNGPSIERILVLDDNKNNQQDFAFPIEAADRTPVIVDGPLGPIEAFLNAHPAGDAAISDYQLAPGNYAEFDGAELVSRWYKRGFPAVLCTTFGRSNAAQFRLLRRWIPVVMSPHELDPDSLVRALELTQREIREEFVAARRPWRALVRFVEFDDDSNTANAKLPGWSDEVVAFRATDLSPRMRGLISNSAKAGDEYRCFATANLGSESNDDLYVTGWELPEDRS